MIIATLFEISFSSDDPRLTWIKYFDTNEFQSDYVRRIGEIVIDRDNNIIVMTNLETQETNTDIMVQKYDSKGKLLWKRSYADSGRSSERARTICIDQNNNIYVAGESWPLSKSVIIKYDPRGTLKWVREDLNSIPIKILSHDHEIYLYEVSRRNLAVNKYSLEGDLQWSTQLTEINFKDSRVDARDMTFDAYENVYLTANFDELGKKSLILIKLSSNGTKEWQVVDKGAGILLSSFLKIHIDQNQRINIISEELFTEENDKHNQYSKIALLCYGSNGAHIWTSYYPGSYKSSAVPWDINGDDENNLYVTGYIADGNDKYDLVIAKFNSKGVRIWDRRYPEVGVSRIKVDKSLNIYFSGVTFGEKPIGVLTAKYDQNGERKWENHFQISNGSTDLTITDLGLDRDLNLYILGYYFKALGFRQYFFMKYEN